MALLDLGFGRYQSALDRMANRFRGLSHVSTRCIADEVEAAVRVGQTDTVGEPLAHFAQWAAQWGEAWAGAMVARCHALLNEDEEQYLLALQLHEASIQPYEQARTRLAYGEFLRRQRRKTDARTQLHLAHEAFERLGAGPRADRARLELRATGDNSAARERPDDRLGSLTAQELQVVRLAAAGATNRDIAAQMFLSPRTVGQHLYKAFGETGRDFPGRTGPPSAAGRPRLKA